MFLNQQEEACTRSSIHIVDPNHNMNDRKIYVGNLKKISHISVPNRKEKPQLAKFLAELKQRLQIGLIEKHLLDNIELEMLFY